MLEVGLTAPDFSLLDQHSAEVSLSKLRGRWVLLYFYPRDETPGCTAEACGIRDAWQDFEAAGIAVLGVSDDTVKKHKKFIANHQLPFTLLADTEREVIRQYGALAEMSMFGKKYMGILRISYLIDPTGKIRKVYEKVDPDSHAEEILKDFKTFK